MFLNKSMDNVRYCFLNLIVLKFMLLPKPVRLTVFFLPIPADNTDPVLFDVILVTDGVEGWGRRLRAGINMGVGESW